MVGERKLIIAVTEKGKIMAKKWNCETHSYEEYRLPEGAVLYSEDFNEEVSCADCGGKVIFGETYTSRKIHGSFGLGFAICEACKNRETEELERRSAYAGNGN